jgi:putative membrane-bound dehydrogenase-like protein
MLNLLPLLLVCQGPQDLSDQFELPDQVRAWLWAETPALYNPTAIDVDDQGRLWVAEAVNYRQWNGRNPGRHHDQGDRIMVLEDRDGDGLAETSTLFVQDPDLTAPLGIAVVGNDVYVSCSPNLYVYRDYDGDLKADEREIVLSGFGGHDHDHGLHSVVPAPDGSLLWVVGNAGPHIVTDADGQTLRSGSVYNGGGSGNPGNRPGLVSDDGRVWTGGLIGRVQPNGSGLQVLAHNFRNPYEVAVDSFGNLFTADNDDDGNRACRTVALMEGGNYGYFSADGSRTWQADRRPGLDTVTAHWHQDDPGVMPHGTITGSGSPTGVTVYEANLFPQFLGNVLNADAGRSLVFRHVPKLQGAALQLQTEVLIQPSKSKPSERGHWFRPSDVAVGPDGSIYIADWYDPGVGGHAAGDREAYGRILRLTPSDLQGYAPIPGQPFSQPPIEGNIPAVASIDERIRLARCIWRWAADATKKGSARISLQHPDPWIRLTTYRALLAVDGVSNALAQKLAQDESPWVRAQVAASLRDLSWQECGQTLLTLAEQYDGADRTYLEAIGLGATGKEERLFLDLIISFDPIEERGQLLDFAWRLHPPSAAPFLWSVVDSDGLPLEIRRKALHGLAFMKEREVAERMVSIALAGAPDIRPYAVAWVKQRSEGIWSGYGLEAAVGGDFVQAQQIWRSDIMKAGQVSLDLPLQDAKVLWLVTEDGGDGNGYDWGAWLRPRLQTPTGEVSLTTLPWAEAQSAWGEVRRNLSCDGSPLTVGGKAIRTGIGTHAYSRIAFVVPPGASRFLAECAPDDGGRLQAGSQTSVQFSVYLEKQADVAADMALQQAALRGDLAAAKTLSQTVPGALFLLEETRREKLSSEVLDAIRVGLQSHPDLSVRALASEAFPLQTLDGKALPPLAELAALPGNASRGRELFRGRAACFSCHSYQQFGGSVGPDLTAVRQKFGRAEILDAMIHPSAGIAFGFDSYSLTLKDGRQLAGAILADGERVVLRDLSGRRQVIDADQIQSRHHLQVSTMPSALSLGLQAQDLADLTSFLDADQDRSPMFGPEIELFNGVDRQGWHWQLPAGVDPDSVWSVSEQVLRCEGKPSGYLYTADRYQNFELSLEWRFDPQAGPGNSGVLLRVQEPHKVWPHSIEAQLQAGNAGDIWNIDQFPMAVAADRTSGRRTVKLLPSNERPLGEWNRYRIRLHGDLLTLEVNGQVQNTATWCEEKAGVIALQSEGAVIEFRNIRLRPILN